MYPVSNAFLTAVKANTRKYYWTGRITTTAGTDDFYYKCLHRKKITANQLYKVLLNFDKMYFRMTDLEKKQFMKTQSNA